MLLVREAFACEHMSKSQHISQQSGLHLHFATNGLAQHQWGVARAVGGCVCGLLVGPAPTKVPVFVGQRVRPARAAG